MEESTSSKLFMNPLIKKLTRVGEHDPNRAATYGGISAKTCFFMLLAAAGIFGYYWFRGFFETGDSLAVEGVRVYLHEGIILAIAGVISCFAPLLAFLIRPLVPFLGSLYCLSFGYSMAFLANNYGARYRSLIAAAVFVTVLLVALMAILYATGIVKVNHKLRAVLTILFFTSLLIGLLTFIGSFIPGLNLLIADLRANAVLAIGGGIVYVVIACLFLLVDFDTIQQTVTHQLPKKYEWIAAFGLSYTVFYLYLKVFSLLSRLNNNSNRNGGRF